MYKFTKFVICICMVFTLVLTLSVSTLAANEMKSSNRRIAIVFDNSDSMIVENKEYIPRWAEATFALKTLVNMLDSEDIVHLYSVGIKNYGGKDGYTVSPQNIDEILSTIGISETTNTTGMEKAYEWASSGSEDESWVVIITDGAFTEGSNYLEAKNAICPIAAESYADKHVQTICIGLQIEKSEKGSTNKKQLEEFSKNNHYFTFYNAGKNDIQDTLLKISETIYNMEKLDNEMISASEEIVVNGNTLTWKSDLELVFISA